MRPSMMWADWAPPLIASTQACSFGRMPPSISSSRTSTSPTVAEVEEKLDGIDGGMRPKLTACIDAIRGGSQSAHIVDGRKPHSLLLELFTDAGIGTMVTP